MSRCFPCEDPKWMTANPNEECNNEHLSTFCPPCCLQCPPTSQNCSSFGCQCFPTCSGQPVSFTKPSCPKIQEQYQILKHVFRCPGNIFLSKDALLLFKLKFQVRKEQIHSARFSLSVKTTSPKLRANTQRNQTASNALTQSTRLHTQFLLHPTIVHQVPLAFLV